MTEREKFWQLLTLCTDSKAFKYDSDRRLLSIEIPILPENIADFHRNILYMFGSSEIPIPTKCNNPYDYNYKFDTRYINIDGITIKRNKWDQIEISEDNVINNIEDKVLTKLGIDIKNDEIFIDSFNGFNTISQEPFEKNNLNYTYIKSGLDYSNRDNWFLFPQHNAGLLDVFILYPSTVNDPDKNLIIDISDKDMARGIRDFLKIIIPIFKDLPVNLYMPKYKQINSAKLDEYTVRWMANNGRDCINDVYNAFGYFLRECQGTNSFITFSHEQGSIFNYLLCTDFIQFLNPEILNKWKNVWALGIGLDDTILTKTPFTSSGLPTDDKTIISWNLSTPTELDKNRKNFGDGTSVCINPVTFTKTYLEQIYGKRSLIKYYENNIFQIKKPIATTIIQNKWENQIIQTGFDEKTLLSEEQLEIRNNNNLGYLLENTIGLFAENIRDNIISRYNLIT